MDSRRRKWIACITGICVLAGIVSFPAYRNDRQRLAQEQAEAEWETRYAQDVADIEARYAENREDLYRVFEAFQMDETLKTVFSFVNPSPNGRTISTTASGWTKIAGCWQTSILYPTENRNARKPWACGRVSV